LAATIYLLCALTSALCAFLLLRAYTGSRLRLLFWGGLCFGGLTLNNLLLVLDRVVFSEGVDLRTWRLAAAFVALLPLLYGLIWEEK
jgi:hypothetical protein